MISIDILMYSLNISQFYHTIQRYKGCKEDASVELIRLNGAGHQWPLGIPWSQRRFTTSMGKMIQYDINIYIFI